MSNQKSPFSPSTAIFILCILIAIIIGVGTSRIVDGEMNGHRIVYEIRKEPGTSHHGNTKPPVNILTPIQKLGPGGPYNDPHPLTCSRITYAGKNINSTVIYTVPEGWSVWRCLKERFPSWDDREMMSSLHILQFYMNDDTSLKYHDPNRIPVGYTMVGGGDGGGPGPTNE